LTPVPFGELIETAMKEEIATARPKRIVERGGLRLTSSLKLAGEEVFVKI